MEHNDKFPTSSLLVVISLVAFTTYFTIFNLTSLVTIFSHLYASKKRHVVTQMKSDSRPAWKNRAERFEVFRPKHENPEPSEWYVALYAVLNPASVLGWGLRLKLGGRRAGGERGVEMEVVEGEEEDGGEDDDRERGGG